MEMRCLSNYRIYAYCIVTLILFLFVILDTCDYKSWGTLMQDYDQFVCLVKVRDQICIVNYRQWETGLKRSLKYYRISQGWKILTLAKTIPNALSTPQIDCKFLSQLCFSLFVHNCRGDESKIALTKQTISTI